MKKIFIFIFVLLFFLALKVPKANADDLLIFSLHSDNRNIRWEVGMMYSWRDRSGTNWSNVFYRTLNDCCRSSGGWYWQMQGRFVSMPDGISHKLRWSTACIDPLIDTEAIPGSNGWTAGPIDIGDYRADDRPKINAVRTTTIVPYTWGTGRNTCPFKPDPPCQPQTCASRNQQCGSFTTCTRTGGTQTISCGGCPGTQVCNSNNNCEQNYSCTNDGSCVRDQCQRNSGNPNCFAGNTCGGNCTGPIAGEVTLPNGRPYTDRAYVLRKNNNAANWNENNRDLTSGADGTYRFGNLPTFGQNQDIRLARTEDNLSFNADDKVDSCLYTTDWIKGNVNVPNSNVNFRLNWTDYVISGQLRWDPTPQNTNSGDEIQYDDSPQGKSGVRVRIFNAQGNLQGEDFTGASSRFSIGGINTDANHAKSYEIRVATGNNSFSINPNHYVVGGSIRSDVTQGCVDQTQNFFITATPVGPTYTIQGGLYNDTDDPQGEKNPSELYIPRAGTENIVIQGIDPTNLGVSETVTDFGTPGNGFTSTVPLHQGRYRLNFNNMARPNYILTSPNPVIVTVGTGCSGGGVGTCDASNNVINLNFGIKDNSGERWLQSVGGDVRFDKPDYRNVVPDGATCSNTTQPYVSANSLPEAPSPKLPSGVVFGNNSDFTGVGGSQNSKAGPKGWFVGGNLFSPSRAGTIKTSYAYFKASIGNTSR